MRRILLAGALVVTTITGAAAEDATIWKFEEPVGVLVVDDGRIFEVTEETTILMTHEPVALETFRSEDVSLPSGDLVALASDEAGSRSGDLLALRDDAPADTFEDEFFQPSALVREPPFDGESATDEMIQAP